MLQPSGKSKAKDMLRVKIILTNRSLYVKKSDPHQRSCRGSTKTILNNKV